MNKNGCRCRSGRGAKTANVYAAVLAVSEMPGWGADKTEVPVQNRGKRGALRREAVAAAAAKPKPNAQREEKRKAKNRSSSGPVPRPPSKDPDHKTQRNFTDPDSRGS